MDPLGHDQFGAVAARIDNGHSIEWAKHWVIHDGEESESSFFVSAQHFDGRSLRVCTAQKLVRIGGDSGRHCRRSDGGIRALRSGLFESLLDGGERIHHRPFGKPGGLFRPRAQCGHPAGLVNRTPTVVFFFGHEKQDGIRTDVQHGFTHHKRISGRGHNEPDMAKLLGIDVGTSGCKVLLIDERGTVLRQASASYPLSVPRPMWSEQNPEDWWTGVQTCLAEIGDEKVDAIGVAGQMHGAVMLDENDAVIRPAILWNDQRTVAECAEIDAAVGSDRLKEITCNPPLTGFQLPKLLWVRNHEPENYARIRSLLLPKDYIRFKLTGEKVAEVSDASGTGIFDVSKRTWSPEIADRLGVDLSIFPMCVESAEVIGRSANGVPVIGGGGDQAAGAVGTGAVVPGIISVSLGTSGVVFTSLEAPTYDLRGAAHTFCHANRKWHAMGVMLSCGGALTWARDVLFPGASFDEITESASQSAVGSKGLVFLPYLTGERCPHNDPYAQGVFAGLTLASDRASIARSILEGISFGLLDGMNLLRELGASTTDVRVTSGGAKSKFWVQMLADMFGAPCATLESDEGPAFGAAVLAGVGIGIWPDVARACEDTVRIKSVTNPSGSQYAKSYERFLNLYRSNREWFRM